MLTLSQLQIGGLKKTVCRSLTVGRFVAQYDVYRFDGQYALDCQADIHSQLATRFVVPLFPVDSEQLKQRLNPVFEVGNTTLAMKTEFAVSVFKNDLGPLVCSLDGHGYEIQAALDVLITGV